MFLEPKTMDVESHNKRHAADPKVVVGIDNVIPGVTLTFAVDNSVIDEICISKFDCTMNQKTLEEEQMREEARKRQEQEEAQRKKHAEAK